MREVAPTRSAAIALADERKLMRQGYDFLDEKRTLLASEMLRQLKLYQKQTEELAAATQDAADALALALERHGLDQLQSYPAPAAPDISNPRRSLFLGLAMLTAAKAADNGGDSPAVIDTSPEAKACRAAFESLLALSADTALRAGNLNRLAREYRRTERRAQALEKVLLPEVAEAIKQVNEQLDTMEREETIRTRWSSRSQNQ
jgi:V/A-type H+-transporting ATPase subunit D